MLVFWWAPQRKYAANLKRKRVLSIESESHASRQIAREYPRIPANTPRIPTEHDREYPANTHKWKTVISTYSRVRSAHLPFRRAFILPSPLPSNRVGGRASGPSSVRFVGPSVGRSVHRPAGRSVGRSVGLIRPSARRCLCLFVGLSVRPLVGRSARPSVRPFVAWPLGWLVGRS